MRAPGRPRLGFLGVGRIGRLRLAGVAAAGAAEIAAVADPSPEALDAVRGLAPGAATGRSIDDLLALDLDGLVIATPNGGHAAETIAALDRGLAVFCQKPLARTTRETRVVLDAARRADRLLGVDLCYRRTAAVEAVAGLIGGGALGDVYAADFVFHNAYGPDRRWFYDLAQSGGGCAIDLGTHLIDLAQWLQPGAVVDVASARFAGGRPLPPGLDAVEDFASARLVFASGAVATVTCSWQSPAGRDAIIEGRWFGTRGGARVANVDGSFFDFVAERLDGTRTERLVEPPDDWGPRTLLDWTARLAAGARYDRAAEDVLRTAAIIDRVYGRDPGPATRGPTATQAPGAAVPL
jgi:predicted dehydrogenase